MKKSIKPGRLAVTILSVLLMVSMLTFPALADTDGTELQVTAQPEKLIVELGGDWAGVEFELRTDVGLFPVPVIVSETGVLAMELGGSSTYTLTRISDPITQTPEPDDITPVAPEITVPEDPDTSAPAEPEPPEPEVTAPVESDPPADDAEGDGGIPVMHLVIFLGGLAIAAGGLIIMYVIKRRNAYYDDDYGEDE